MRRVALELSKEPVGLGAADDLLAGAVPPELPPEEPGEVPEIAHDGHGAADADAASCGGCCTGENVRRMNAREA